MIYVAAPYSTGIQAGADRDAAMAKRAEEIERIAAQLLELGEPVYSPVTHGRALEKHIRPDLCASHAFWMRHCYQMLDCARELVVIMLPGWSESAGVQQEIKYAERRGIPINYLKV